MGKKLLGEIFELLLQAVVEKVQQLQESQSDGSKVTAASTTSMQEKPSRTPRVPTPRTRPASEQATSRALPKQAPSPRLQHCKVPGCTAKIKCKEFCHKHYQSFRRGRIDDQGMSLKVPVEKKPCIFPGCSHTASSKGFCSNHYQQFMRGRISAEGERLVPVRPPKAKAEPCRMRGCTKPKASAMGFCTNHYQMFKRGSIDEEGKRVKKTSALKKSRTICKVLGCRKRTTHESGFCSNHLQHFRRGTMDEQGHRLRKTRRRREPAPIVPVQPPVEPIEQTSPDPATETTT